MAEPEAKSRHRNSLRLLIASPILAAAVLGGGYLTLGGTAVKSVDAPLEDVTMALIVYPGACPLVVAQARGLFAGQGMRVRFDTYSSGKSALDAVFQGKADLATSGDIPMMFAAMNRQPLAIVATIATAENDIGIVGRKDKEIGLPVSLKGKRVGATLGTSGQFVLDGFLTRQRLSYDDVNVRDLKPEELADALERDVIDAASVWQPFPGALQAKLGDNATTFLSGDIYDVAFSLAGTMDYVTSHARTVQKVLRAAVQADRLCNDSPDEARKMVGDAFKISTADLQLWWPTYRFDVALEQSLLLALEDESQWAIKHKLTDRVDVPNYWHHLYLDALEAVSPTKVTVIH